MKRLGSRTRLLAHVAVLGFVLSVMTALALPHIWGDASDVLQQPNVDDRARAVYASLTGFDESTIGTSARVRHSGLFRTHTRVRLAQSMPIREAEVEEWGWPFRSLGGGRAEGPGFITTTDRFSWTGSAIQVRDANGVPRLIPARPLWLGFAGNWLFWGLVAAAVLVVRRVRRVDRLDDAQQCLACGYGPMVARRCPECGERSRRGQFLAVYE